MQKNRLILVSQVHASDLPRFLQVACQVSVKPSSASLLESSPRREQDQALLQAEMHQAKQTGLARFPLISTATQSNEGQRFFESTATTCILSTPIAEVEQSTDDVATTFSAGCSEMHQVALRPPFSASAHHAGALVIAST